MQPEVVDFEWDLYNDNMSKIVKSEVKKEEKLEEERTRIIYNNDDEESDSYEDFQIRDLLKPRPNWRDNGKFS